jgi:hypothetical protein
MDLRTEIAISASPEQVWSVLTDTGRYHEWNPFITTVEGTLELGQDLTVVVSPPGRSDFRFRPHVTVAKAGEELRWKGKLVAEWLLTGEHFFRLLPQADGTTRFVHGEDFRGFLTKFLGPQMTATARGFVFMNQALKQRVEALLNRP